MLLMPDCESCRLHLIARRQICDYDLVDMSIFQKLFGSQPDAVLKKSDLVMARDEIADMHKKLNEQAAKEGGEYIFKVEYVSAWQTFRDAPSIDTAHHLLDVAPHLLEYFEMCSPGHSFYSTSRYLKERGIKT